MSTVDQVDLGSVSELNSWLLTQVLLITQHVEEDPDVAVEVADDTIVLCQGN
jgi:hypothetical protein